MDPMNMSEKEIFHADLSFGFMTELSIYQIRVIEIHQLMK